MARLGEMLVGEGVLTPGQLQEALEIQKKDGGLLGGILVSKGFLTESVLVDTLSRQSGTPTVDLEKTPPDPALAKVLPEAKARKIGCVPVKLNGHVLHVAMLSPDDATVEQVSFLTGKTVKAMVAGPAALESAWRKLYAGAANGETKVDFNQLDKVISGALDEVKVEDHAEEAKEEEILLGSEDPPVVKLVNAALLKAVHERASDIHFEPLEGAYQVRFRIDGVMHKVMDLPASLRSSVVSRIKIMSQMDIAERRLPQDGRIKVTLHRQTYDFRVNCLPSVHGEKVVIRILGQGSLKGSVDDLGFQGKALDEVRSALRNPYGMVLVTGPTGSGKTTTLYTMLKQLNTPDVNVVTAEDPVEYHLGGITQVSVKPYIGYTFDLALRAFLRQDPDVILVGEMRDYETAAIAIKAALTGHLVLSTLHTNDAPATVVRLVDMGLEPYLVASAVKLVIAQRLVRRICENCKEEVAIGDQERADLRDSAIAAIERVYRGRGCGECRNIGYRGRVPVFEVMPVRSREMRRVITEGGTEVQVAQVARREDMRTLKEHVLQLVNDGVTSLEEAYGILLAE